MDGHPLSATLRPLSFLFDSLAFRTEIAVVWLPSLLADLRRIPIPMPGGAFIRYPCLAGRPLRCCSSATGRNKPPFGAMELVGKAANATIEPQPAICLLKSRGRVRVRHGQIGGGSSESDVIPFARVEKTRQTAVTNSTPQAAQSCN